jgi:hypothetical protein
MYNAIHTKRLPIKPQMPYRNTFIVPKHFFCFVKHIGILFLLKCEKLERESETLYFVFVQDTGTLLKVFKHHYTGTLLESFKSVPVCIIIDYANNTTYFCHVFWSN